MCAKPEDWFVIAIGGVTCGGKSTLASSLHKHLPHSKLLSQDTYFYPDDSPHHVKVNGLDHVNYDILSSLDMERMLRDVLNIFEEPYIVTNGKSKCVTQNGSSNNHIQNGDHTNGQNNNIHYENRKVLIVEGFCILNYKPISDLCDLKFELLLSKEECLKRRNVRVYDPPDIPGYFELCVWPEYLNLKQKLVDQKDIISLDGTDGNLLSTVMQHMNTKLVL